jgi:hypothetical protein
MKRRINRGATLVEVTFAAALSTVVLFGAISSFLSGMTSWARGQGRIDAENGSQRATRQIARELRQAMSVVVDADGNGLTYRMPAMDTGGSFKMPVIWDNVTRRIYVSNNSIYVSGGGTARRLCTGVIGTDPQSPGGTGSYKLFTAGSGSITRSLSVMVVSRQIADKNNTAVSRSRETIFLRNIPQLVK